MEDKSDIKTDIRGTRITADQRDGRRDNLPVTVSIAVAQVTVNETAVALLVRETTLPEEVSLVTRDRIRFGLRTVTVRAACVRDR